MTVREKLLNPTGADRNTGGNSLAPRPASLRGLTVGLLGNTKPNAEVLLGEVAAELKNRYEVGEFRTYTKDYFGTPVKPDLFQQIAADCDLVITAVGDCGSCSAATVAAPMPRAAPVTSATRSILICPSARFCSKPTVPSIASWCRSGWMRTG